MEDFEASLDLNVGTTYDLLGEEQKRKIDQTVDLLFRHNKANGQHELILFMREVKREQLALKMRGG